MAKLPAPARRPEHRARLRRTASFMLSKFLFQMKNPLLRAVLLAAPVALGLLTAACTDKPKTTDPEKTAVVVPAEANAAADSTAAKMDSTGK